MKRLLSLAAFLALALPLCSKPTRADPPVVVPLPVTMTSNASPAIIAAGLAGNQTCTFYVTGTPGAINAWGSNDPTFSNKTQLTIVNMSDAVQPQPFTPTIGVQYQILVGGLGNAEIAPDATYGAVTSTVNLRCSGTPMVPPAPLPTAPGAVGNVFPPAFTEVAPSSNPTTGPNTGVIDNNGGRAVYLCPKNNASCVNTIVKSFAGQIILLGGFFPTNKTETSNGTTCTAVATTPATGTMFLYGVEYASSAVQTGTLTLYDEGASPTCAATDAVYVSVAHAVASVPDVAIIPLTAGLAYKWSAAEVQRVLLLYL